MAAGAWPAAFAAPRYRDWAATRDRSSCAASRSPHIRETRAIWATVADQPGSVRRRVAFSKFRYNPAISAEPYLRAGAQCGLDAVVVANQAAGDAAAGIAAEQ